MRTMTPRAWKASLFAGLIAVVLVASFAFYRRGAFSQDYRWDLPPCFEAGEPYHHRFKPNCRESVRTPQGRVEFQTNEDGLRDLPKELLLSLPNRVLLLGDSFVEGWWLREDQAINTRLRELDPKKYFINAGLRASGPLFQARRLPELLDHYKPKEAVIVLDDTDIYDDRLACAVAKGREGDPSTWSFAAPEFESPGWQRFLLARFEGWRMEPRLREYFYGRRLANLVNSDEAKACDPCLGLQSLKANAEAKKVKFRALLLDLGHRASDETYNNAPGTVEAIQTCLRNLHVPFFAVRFDELTPAEENKYFWGVGAYLNPLGIQWWAAKIEEAGAPLAKN
jgi:hypothetical protein